MADRKEFAKLLRHWPSAAVLIVTFGLTLLKDLTFGIVSGCALAAVLALIRRKVPEEGA
jgi:SulP family sulfate permease